MCPRLLNTTPPTVRILPLRESYTYLIFRTCSLLWFFLTIHLLYFLTYFCCFLFSNYVSVPTSGHQISIVLWGERAIAFEGDWVLETGKENPVIAIFVGTLVKNYDGPYTGSYSFSLPFYALFIQTNII